MEQKIRELIKSKFEHNNEIHKKLNQSISVNYHSVLVHMYNQNLQFIRELEALLK